MDSATDTSKEKNVSCFALDGVVAEMVIEVEDNQKPGFEESSDSPSKNSNNRSEENANSEKKEESDIITLTEIPRDKDPEDKISETSETPDPLTTDSSEQTQPSAPDSSESNQTPGLNSSESKPDDESADGKKLANQEKKVQNIKKVMKRKRKVTANQILEESSGMARYPGRKRQANKRYISDEMVTSTANKSESSLSKETHKGEKRRKLDAKDEKNVSQKKSVVSSAEDGSKRGKEEPPKTKNELAHKIKSEYPEVPEENPEDVPKHKTLRKLPFRKNKDAPEVPDFKPNVIWWNGVGEGMGAKLGDLPEVSNRIQGAKSVRALYRVLFYQWPTNGQDLVGQILEFNGFPFDRTSYEFTKRQSLMKIMLDNTIANVCEILGVRKGSKNVMISNILNFLLRPYGTIDPTLDPKLQPVVVLERIVLGDKFFLNPPESTKRKRGRPKGKNRKEIPPPSTRETRTTKRKSPESPPDNKTPVKENLKTKPSPPGKKNAPDVKRGKISATETAKVPKDVKSKIEEKAIQGSTDEKESTSNKTAASKITKKIRKKKKLKPGNKVASKESAEDAAENRNNAMDFEIEIDSSIEEIEEPSSSNLKEKEIKELPKESKLDLKSTSDASPDSSETESAEETRLVTASVSTSKSSPKSHQMRRGQPLKAFPKISDSIKNANFAALQRLHILLFGAADKAENLKGNILAFGGFPFLEGSDEWKQKHFLLSLLAQNNLREYLKLLCIQFSDDDQPTMINKLMRFLACPTEAALGKKSPEKPAEVKTTEVKRKETEIQPKKDKIETKKKIVKKKEEKKGPRHRKVLMSEEEARRLEASFAREQRAIARDQKAPPPIMQRQPSPPPVEHYASMKPMIAPKPPLADPKQLNALLQTVYKRRALKAAGAVISTPSKGEKMKLGDIENIKFLIVTSNFKDLEVLHQLIYMYPASKSRLRKNILDFDGFGFNEDCVQYKERIDFLNNLGYEISKRVSFLLGLCPLQTEIPQQDLNELIMYFLMSPCKSKQVVPITQMPANPTRGLSAENFTAPPSPEVIKSPQHVQSSLKQTSVSSPSSTIRESNFQSSTPFPSKMRQKARKSFGSTLKMSPVKKILLPPAATASINRILNFTQKQAVASAPKSAAALNPVQALPTYSLPKAMSVSLLSNPGTGPPSKPSGMNTLIKVPAGAAGNPSPKVAISDAAAKIPASSVPHVAGQVLQNPVVIPGKIPLSAQQTPVLAQSKVAKGNISPPQEFLVQQQMPDGQQKTFKLIRLPPNHPLTNRQVVNPAVQPAVPQPLIITGGPVRGGLLPPGIIVMKNNPTFQLPSQNILQTVPLKVNVPVTKVGSPLKTAPNVDEFIIPDRRESAGTSKNDSDTYEVPNPVQEKPPSDCDLYSSIQEIILSSNFEDITLRNVIDKVQAQYPDHDLSHRHNFMKECVKKIIIGT